MQLHCKQAILEEEKCAALVIGVLKDAHELRLDGNDLLKKVYNDFMATKDFKGKINETSILYGQDALGPTRILFVGLGEAAKYDLEKVRQAAGTAAKTLTRLGVREVSVALESFASSQLAITDLGQAVAEGTILATYQYRKFKEVNSEEEYVLDEITCLVHSPGEVEPAQAGMRLGKTVAEATNFCRDLQNHPGNWLTPARLADMAGETAEEYGLKCQVLDRAEMEDLKMGALLGVAKGSQEPPKLIVLEHNSRESQAATVVLVGKGITFDSGGISIKPGEKMEEMKFDMSGGGAVIGAMRAVAELDIPLHVVGLIPASENLPSGSSMKPGDILTVSSGKTIEIVNTDAEGRLILADTLAYAQRYQPEAVVDLATLTGACVVALGHYATGLMGNDASLIERVRQAGETCGERVWQLPLWENYQEDIKSDYADMKNVGGKAGGAITAAALLANFTDYPWAHLDIAGTAWTSQESAYVPKGGTGVGVRLLVQFLRDWVEEK